MRVGFSYKKSKYLNNIYCNAIMQRNLAASIFWQRNYENMFGKLFEQYLQYNIFFYILFYLINAEIHEILFCFLILEPYQ